MDGVGGMDESCSCENHHNVDFTSDLLYNGVDKNYLPTRFATKAGSGNFRSLAYKQPSKQPQTISLRLFYISKGGDKRIIEGY